MVKAKTDIISNQKNTQNRHHVSSKSSPLIQENPIKSKYKKNNINIPKISLNCKPKRKFKLFKYQVAGHNPMFYNQNEGTLYKPATQGETDFYSKISTLLPKIKEFIPECKGFESKLLPHMCLDKKETIKNKTAGWSNYCFDRQKDKLSNMPFIILEDITNKFVHPCILDLKIGIRHHKVICNNKKLYRKLKKSYKSTNKLFGNRIGGMSTYNNITKTYELIDKRQGNDFTGNQFCNRLTKFFSYNNGKLRIDLINNIINKINKLMNILKNENRFRWFSCSLLIVYEGKSFNTYESGSMTPPAMIPNYKTPKVPIFNINKLPYTSYKDDSIFNNNFGNIDMENNVSNNNNNIKKYIVINKRNNNNNNCNSNNSNNCSIIDSNFESKIDDNSDDSNDDSNDSNDNNDDDSCDITKFVFKDIQKTTLKHNQWFDHVKYDFRLIDFSNFVDLKKYLNNKGKLRYNITESNNNGCTDMEMKEHLQLDNKLDNLKEPDYGILFGLTSLKILLTELINNGFISKRNNIEWIKFRDLITYSKKAIIPFDKFNFDKNNNDN